MSQQNDNGIKTFIADSAVEAFRLVKLISASGTNVVHNGAGETDIEGVTQAPAAAGENVSVKLISGPGTFKITGAEAITVGDPIYAAADGKMKDSAEGNIIGKVLETVTADLQIAECTLL